MASGDAMDVDQRVLVYTWRSMFSAAWSGSRFDGRIVTRAVPPGVVFVVLVREEDTGEPGIHGSIERWNWVEEDPELPQAPVGWATRYGSKLWSKT